MNDLDILAGAAMGMTGLFMIMQVSMLGSGERGWITRPWYSRGAMVVVAVLFWVRAWSIFHGQPMNPIGRIVALAVLVWQFLELIEVITSSWRGNTAKLIRQARRERRQARRVLKLAIALLPPAPPYTTFHRFGPERDKPPTL